tara:strand:+ start:188 stop:670 length:483 start_codon:yes stop_codon:yes gene_type:complete
LADQTILSKWQALFPNNSPESNPNAVNGQGTDGDYNLVNAVKSPFREASEAATDSWSYKNEFPIKGDTDILAMWDSTSILTNRPADPSYDPVEFADQAKSPHPLKLKARQNVYTSKQQNPGGSLNRTRLLTQNDIDGFEQFTVSPSIESENDVITMAQFT